MLYLAIVELTVSNINILENIFQLDDIAFLKGAVQFIDKEVPQCPDSITFPGAFFRWREDETIIWIIGPASIHGFFVEAKATVQFYPDIARCS